EDDPDTRALLTTLIEAVGCRVSLAKDGEVALEMLAHTYYDVILLDIALPKLSGTAVMEVLRQRDPEALGRVIVVTGLKVEEIRKLFPTVCHALAKPVMPKRLLDSIHQCLASRRTEPSDARLTMH
ncbi:MAG: response regulator, partial [Thermoanaerobaculia bacterium]